MVVDAINYRDVDDENVQRAHWVVRLFLLVFVFVCVFDPADQILGGKVFIFVALWGLTAINILLMRDSLYLPSGLVIYVGIFIAIPLLSILWYFIINGKQPFEGFGLLKGYLFVSFAIVLFLNRVDLIPQMSAVLTILACSVIAVFVAIELEPDLFETLYPLGASTGVMILDNRNYGDFVLIQVYFVTSPMLAISIAYYFDRTMSEQGIARKLVFLLLTAINIAGMFLAGTRNNIFVSLLLPFLLWPLYTKRVALSALCSFGILAVLALPFADQLRAFLDPSEVGNSIKLTTLQDYFQMFADPVTLLFGHGLGAYETWSAGPYFYVTELTYPEMVRNFGLIGALVMLALLLFPIANAFFAQAGRRERTLAVAYFLYLAMCVSNPNLFSSMGMLILAGLLANIFLARDREMRAAQRSGHGHI
jgi:hypothetical protein